MRTHRSRIYGTVFLALSAAQAVVIAAQSAGAADLEKVRVSISQRGSGEADAAELGQKAGIFAKHGLQLELTNVSGTGETIQVIASKAVDIGMGAGIYGILGAFSKGAPVRIIGANYRGDSLMFWYARADSGIKDPKTAAGKTVAFSTSGSSSHSAVLQMARHAGVAFKPTATGGLAGTLTQVMSGQIDVGWSAAPFAVDRLEKGDIRLLWRASDVPAVAEETVRVIVANAEFANANPDIIRRYIDAYRETVDWIYSSPKGAEAYAEWAGVPLNVAQKTLSEFVLKDSRNPDKIYGLDAIVKNAVALRYTTETLSPKQLETLIQIPPRK